MKRSIAGALIVLATASAASAQEVVREFSWTELKKSGQLNAGEIQTDGPSAQHEQLKIDNPTDRPRTVTLLDVKKPGVTAINYALEGKVRYENVKGKSYLEMWSWFADGGRYFTRTLSDSGPLQSLEGSSELRPFVLPFFSSSKAGPPTRIVVNVVFVNRGAVHLGSVKLLQYNTADELQNRAGGVPANLPQQRDAWWTQQTAGWIVGICGFLWAMLMTLSMVLYRVGRARRFVLAVYCVLCVLGVSSLALGILAGMLGQPYFVASTLVQAGSVVTLVNGLGIPLLRRRYEQIELRKMAAMDTR